MRVSLNLASHPYVELGPIYLRLRILIAALALVALSLWLLLRVETHNANAAHARLAAAEQRVTALQNKQQSYRSNMREPQNASVLQQSRFLNQLFQRKAFSWTAVMMDLENVLPGGVQVENIDPVISHNGNVTIHLRVNGQHDRAVDLVRNLEHSRSFLYPRLAGETAETAQSGRGGFQQVNSGSDVNFDILADYNPLPTPAQTAASKHRAKSAGNGVQEPPARSAARNSSRRHAAHGKAPETVFPTPRKAGPQ